MTRIRVLGLGAALLALAASSTDGQRAGTGWCPEGEQCADDTPEGLMFEGAQVSWFVGNGVIPTAVGGSQSVRITDKQTGLPLDLPFLAEATNREAHSAAVAGEALARIGASGAGTGHLRIARVQDDYLFDRLAIESKPIVRAEVRGTIAGSWPTIEARQIALWAGGEAELSVALLAAEDGWLADETLQIETSAPSEPVAWDAVRVAVPAVPGDLTVGVDTASGFSARLNVPIVDGLTEVNPWSSGGNQPVGGEVDVCFMARNGILDVQGVDWSFDLIGGVEPLPAAEQKYPNCLSVRFTSPGSARVAASADGLSASVEYDVTSGAARQLAGSRWPWAGETADPGERALRE